MRRWFSAQPIHRKLVLTSMAKTTVVLFAAMVTLMALDVWRFKRNATDDARALGQLFAENLRVSLAFEDAADASATLRQLNTGQQVQRACAYTSDSRLFAEYVRESRYPCPPSAPVRRSAFVLGDLVPVRQDGRVVGSVYVERDWEAIRARLLTAGVTSFAVLVIAALVMLVVSHRLHRNISSPIAQLAGAARRMGQADDFVLPPIAVAPDEVGELVSSFGAMVERVRSAREDLTAINEALRREIEERRLVEAEREALLVREREANRIKDEFLATVSHELRTPLNAIVGWARILATTTPDAATVQKAASSLHRNAQTQARVIDDLIDISRIVTGKLRVMTEPVDLRSVVEAAVEAIRPSAAHAGITLAVNLPQTACVIQGDRDRLQQIVWNLLSNAVKFAPGGRVAVAVTADGDRLKLTVTDDGIGIAPDFIGHVFDRFRQADSSITREHGGLGIGLAVVKELVDLHGGTIQVESRGRGKGAEFAVSFQCFVGDVATAAPDDHVPALPGVSVLVVDDNLDALEVLEAALTAAGADVRRASSGAEALELWQEKPSDVLLCDLAMPHMSGFQLLARIRDLDRVAGRVTPAIAVTAHATEEQVARSVQAGFQVHITKPVDANRLIRSVAAARTRV